MHVTTFFNTPHNYKRKANIDMTYGFHTAQPRTKGRLNKKRPVMDVKRKTKFTYCDYSYVEDVVYFSMWVCILNYPAR